MKRYFFSMLTLVFYLLTVYGCNSSSRFSGNPVFEGWYADPEAAIFNNEYWIFPTFSDEYENQTFFDAFSSKDLTNWKKYHGVLNIDDVKWANKAMWAPSVIYANSRYYLFFGANDIQNNSEMGGIGVAISDSPDGPYVDALGKPLIGEIVNGAQPIDQYVFQDIDGSYYMYYGGWGHCNVVRLSDDLLSIVPFDDGTLYKSITPDNYVEGPFMLLRDGKYYFMWSEGGWGSPDYSVAYAISDSPLGPFKRIGKILEQNPEVASSAGHHSVLHNKKTDEYYIVYHRRPLTETHRNHRQVCIDRLYFDDEGFICPVDITNEGVKSSRL